MKNKKQLLLVLAIMLFNFIIHIPFLNLPAHWDEDAYFTGALAVYNNNLNPFVEFWSYKPPLIFIMTAALFKLFSPSRAWGRLVIVVFSCLSLLFTYLLGKELFSKKTGLLSTVLLFFFPLFMAQSFLFQASIPLTLLTLSTFYFYFTERKVFYFISASLLVLTKEPAVLIILVLGLFDFWKNYSQKPVKTVLKDCLLLLSPLLFFTAWLLLNKKYFGWYLWPYNVAYFSLEQPHNLLAKHLLADLFQDYFLWFIFSLLFSGLVFSLAWKKLRESFLKKEIVFFWAIFWFFLIFFSWGAFLPRYLLFTYPLIFLSFVWLMQVVFKNKSELTVVIIVLLCLGFSMGNFSSTVLAQRPSEWSGERDLHFIRLVYYRKQLAQEMTKDFPEGIIIANWPYSSILSRPFLGYVKKERQVLSCWNTQEKRKVKAFFSEQRDNRPVFLIVFEGRNFCFENQKFDLIKTFKSDYYPKISPVRIYRLKNNEKID